MAEFMPILIKEKGRTLPYLDGQFIVANEAFRDANGNIYTPGAYADIIGVRHKLTVDGQRGEKGERGDKGEQGAVGPTGGEGKQGPRGVTGPTGPKGAQGIQGIQGQRGVQGVEGPPGKPGNIRHWYISVAELEADFSNPDIAMYDLAAINSNDTSEDGRMYYKGATAWVFVTTFKGVEGPQGKQGEQGIQGIQGPQGIGFRWMALWSSLEMGTLLQMNDVALDESGSLYIALAEHIKQADSLNPSKDTEHWSLYLPSIQGIQGPAGPQGEKGKDGVSTYDIVIRTQADFDELIASPTWKGAVNVAFMGDGGNLKYRASRSIAIPANVKEMCGFRGAIVRGEISSGNSYALFKYAVKPTDRTCSIRDLAVEAKGSGDVSGFENCINLVNCSAIIENGYGDNFGFKNCDNLVNCYGEVIVTQGHYDNAGFGYCNNLTNCEGYSHEENNSSGAFCYGFFSCSFLSNVQGKAVLENNTTGSTTPPKAFHQCSYITNANGESKFADTDSYAYCDCSYVSSASGSVGRGSAFKGITTKKDPDSCSD